MMTTSNRNLSVHDTHVPLQFVLELGSVGAEVARKLWVLAALIVSVGCQRPLVFVAAAAVFTSEQLLLYHSFTLVNMHLALNIFSFKN